MKKILFSFFLFFTLMYSVSAASKILGLSRSEAATRLRNGDIGFILQADIAHIPEIARIDPSAPFYAGLLVDSAGDKTRAARLYETALGSSIVKVKRESARKLIPFVSDARDKEKARRIITDLQKAKTPTEEMKVLQGVCHYVLGHYKDAVSVLPKWDQNPSPNTIPDKVWQELSIWNKSIRLVTSFKQQKPGTLPHQELRELIFNNPHSPAFRWVFDELNSVQTPALSAQDRAVIMGRLAAMTNSHSQAIVRFNPAQNGALLLKYPLLLGDLGRAYIAIANKREEGFKQFTDWETALRTGKNAPVTNLSEKEKNLARYYLLFYSGRIRRQQAKHDEAAALFTRALALAPDPTQEDSCIWYILNSTFNSKPGNVPALVKQYAPRWHNNDGFYDILDRLSSYMVKEKRWKDILDLYNVLRDKKDGATTARFAYLLGRAVTLGYIQVPGMTARDFFNVAYQEKGGSYYYRSLAAFYLNKTLDPLDKRAARNTDALPRGDELEFFVKFFEYSASTYAMAYLRENADRYTKQELRTIAGTFAASGRYLESIQITGINMNRPDFVMEKADMYLYYPNPRTYIKLVEQNAAEHKIPTPIFLGLIRTESAFTPAIASHAGAVGLAQIMPGTGKEVAATIKRRGGPDFTVEEGEIDLTNPATNLYMGAFYLRDQINSMGTTMLALLGYNGGPGRINRLRREAPSLPEDIFLETIAINETRNYGKRVMAAAAAYGYLYYNIPMHKTVSDIYKR